MYQPNLYRHTFTFLLCCCWCLSQLTATPSSAKSEPEVVINTTHSQLSAKQLMQEKAAVQQLYEKGRNFYAENEIEEALMTFLQCVERVKSLDNPELHVKITRKLSAIYQELGHFDLAYRYQLQSLEMYENQRDSLGIAKALYEIGNIFFYQNRFESALESYTKSRRLVRALGDSIGIYSCLGALGSVHNRLGDTRKSLRLNLSALQLAKQMKYTEGIAYAMHNIGADYSDLGYCETALSYYQKSLKHKRNIGDTFDEIPTLQSIGVVHLEMDEIDTALEYFNQALQLAQSIDAKSRITEVYYWLSLAYEQKNQLKEAFHYMKSHTQLKASILNENILEEMAQTKTRYEVNKKEKEIVLLKQENELLGKNKEIASWKNYFLVVLIVFVACLLFTSILFFYYYRNQKRYSDLLAVKNQQIQEQNEQLAEVNDLQANFNETLKNKNEQIESQNQQLENSNKELKQFAYIASHDLKEPLRMIGAYTSLLDRRYAKKLDEGAKEFMGFITEATTRMNKLLDDLLSYSKVGTQRLQKEWVKMDEIVEVALANLQLEIKQKQAKVYTSKLPEVKVSRTQMGQLYQNLISNAIKFSNKSQPEIWIDVEKNGSSYVFSVKDNGIGIALEHQERIFEMFSRLHTRQEYDGTGIGLATCKKIVEQHGGSIWVESQHNIGSTFFFTIPYKKQQMKDVAAVYKIAV